MRADQNPKTFVNLAYDWHHDGGFQIEFGGEMWDHEVPASVGVSGTGFVVEGGGVWSPHGKENVEMQDRDGKKFKWPVDCIANIQNLHGRLLWVNDKYR